MRLRRRRCKSFIDVWISSHEQGWDMRGAMAPAVPLCRSIPRIPFWDTGSPFFVNRAAIPIL
jgi:hypothetical protein